MKTKFLILFSLFIYIPFMQLAAQETTSSTGSDITGTQGSVSYTVGQVTNLYLKQANGIVAEGVQQPYEISLVTGITEFNGVSLDIQVYPNPVLDYLKLKIRDLNLKNLVWKIYDSTGKVLNTGNVSDTETLIPVTNYSAGVYLFSVFNKNNQLNQTYQIIKN